jgi:RNA-directed DNA polymerase
MGQGLQPTRAIFRKKYSWNTTRAGELRGWANYHRHMVSKVTFAKMDHAIFQALWRWAKRRHPNKPPGWIRRKYFTCIANNHWVFHGTTTSQGKIQDHRLIRLAYTSIT